MGTPQNTAAIYVRRSAVDSANTEADAFSRSLAAQERECLTWAERQGLTVTEVYRDKTGTSASHFKTNRRPEMERALADIGVGYHTLIVWALDRATRKGMAEIGSMVETIEKAGGRMVSVTDGVDTDDPTARLIMAILAGEENIREVIAYPKTQSGADPLTDAPTPIDDRHLEELGLRVLPPAELTSSRVALSGRPECQLDGSSGPRSG